MNFDTAAGQWQAAGLGLLALCLALAGLSDARQRRIPNALVLMTLVAGLLKRGAINAPPEARY